MQTVRYCVFVRWMPFTGSGVGLKKKKIVRDLY